MWCSAMAVQLHLCWRWRVVCALLALAMHAQPLHAASNWFSPAAPTSPAGANVSRIAENASVPELGLKGVDGAQPQPRKRALALLDDRCQPMAQETQESLSVITTRMQSRFGSFVPQRWGEGLPCVLSRLPASSQLGKVRMALTLDACGGGYDAGIIALLRQLRVPATLFVTGRWMREHPDAMADLAHDPLFELANHGTTHRPASVNGRAAYGIRGTASIAELVEEVTGNGRRIAAVTGRPPAFFRPGTAYWDEVASRIARELGQMPAGFTVAADAGATLPAPAVARNLLGAQDGAILLCHMNRPNSGTREGLRAALPHLLARGVQFVRLGDVQLP